MLAPLYRVAHRISPYIADNTVLPQGTNLHLYSMHLSHVILLLSLSDKWCVYCPKNHQIWENLRFCTVLSTCLKLLWDFLWPFYSLPFLWSSILPGAMCELCCHWLHPHKSFSIWKEILYSRFLLWGSLSCFCSGCHALLAHSPNTCRYYLLHRFSCT